MNKLSIIIPSKTMSNFRACADAARRCEPTARIILVDDRAIVPFGHLECINPFGPFIEGDVHVARLSGEKPFIFSRNINIGIKFAENDDAVLLNDDAILQTPGGFSVLQQAAEDHPEYGLIASTTKNAGNVNQFPQGIGLRQDPRMTCFVAVLIPRRTIDAVGLLDERFVHYGFEDDDYCYRVRQAGLKIGIHDGCFVDHKSLPSTFRGDPSRSASLNGGRELFVEKWGAHPL